MLTKVIPVKFTPTTYYDLKRISSEIDIPMSQLIRAATKAKIKKILKKIKGPTLLSFSKAAINFPDDSKHLTDDEILYNTKL